MEAGNRRVTSTDVARAANISRTAVSLVLNGRADGMIAAEKQDEIRRVADLMGYRPNVSARNLRRQSTRTIGLITDEIASAPFAGPLLSGATEAAVERGYMVLTIDTDSHADYLEGAVAALRERDVDGLLYASASISEIALPPTLRNFPLALANARDPRRSAPAFVPDDYGGQKAATEEVIARGHRNTAFIAGNWDNPASRDRARGYTDAVNAVGLQARVIRARYEIDSHYRVAKDLLSRAERPSAVLCANDRGALGVMFAAFQLGLRVPEDVSIVGFDDEHPLAADAPVPLTTVALPHREMGTRAMVALLTQIQGESPPTVPTETVTIACPMVVRNSLGVGGSATAR